MGTSASPCLEAGLAPAASAEQYAGALIVATQLASRAPLAAPLTEALLEVGPGQHRTARHMISTPILTS